MSAHSWKGSIFFADDLLVIELKFMLRDFTRLYQGFHLLFVNINAQSG